MPPRPVQGTKVTTTEMPFKVAVLRADPNFEQSKRKVVSYEFPRRVFTEDTSKQGAYSNVPNERN